MMVTYDLASPGGVKHHAQDLAEALRARGDDVLLAGPSSVILRDPKVRGFGGVMNFPRNGSDNQLGIWISPRAIAQMLREYSPDVIHVHEPLNPTLPYISAWCRPHIPHVATFHAYAEDEPAIVTLARKAAGAAIFSRFRRAIAVSEPAARYARKAWRHSLSIIPNGVATRRFTASEDRKPGSATRLLFVGRLGDSRKGAAVLYEAYRRLLEHGRPVTLDIAGELGRAPAPPSLPGLRYHGAVDMQKIVDLYRACDIFVAPSMGKESFGMVLLEAMACSKPVVCSDIAGYRPVVPPGGSILVPPGDPAALERALWRIVEMPADQRRAMGRVNREAAERYDWVDIAGAVRQEYLAAIRCHSSHA